MRVIRIISRGGFGRVEEVQLDGGLSVARKVFDPQPNILLAGDIGKLKKRFEREVKVQSSLNPEYFVPVLNSDLSDSAPWFTMPLAEKNLRHEIESSRSGGKVPDAALADVLNSLEQLHVLGFVHRDLKPENVLYFAGGWRLSDFGLVLPTSNITSPLSSVNSAWGTAAYCAPEQASAFRDSTKMVDIYAFGCILHDIFVGIPRVPYSRQTGPGAMGRIIEKCTDDDPKRRFKDVGGLRSALLTLLSTAPILKPSASAAEWAAKLNTSDDWDSQQLEELARYVRAGLDFSDKWTVNRALAEERMELLHSIDPDLFKMIAIEYCNWVKESSFDYQYCDVLILRLEKLVELGDFDVKAAALIAAAELAVSHNRFFVMRQILKLCGSSLDSQLADRLAIEIVVEGDRAKNNFIACARQLTLGADQYHPTIGACLG